MMFRSAATVLMLAVLPLAGCGESEFKKGFDEGFDKSWKESFVKSCVKGAAPRLDAATADQLCTCIAEHMQGKLTRAELANPASERSDKVSEEAADACIAKMSAGGAS